LPRLRQVRQAILSAADRMGQPLDANTNIRLSRLFGGDREGRANLELLRARSIPMAISATRGLQPISNFEFEQALNSVANPDMTAQAALARLDDAISEAERVERMGRNADAYWEQNQSLRGFIGTDPAGIQQESITTNAPSAAQRIAATSAQQQELWENRSNPQAIASYNAAFGPGAAEAVIIARVGGNRQRR